MRARAHRERDLRGAVEREAGGDDIGVDPTNTGKASDAARVDLPGTSHHLAEAVTDVPTSLRPGR